jgi:hypothetical protein
VPKINPSVLNSIDADDIAFAKPVIGKKAPAPPALAITSYHPRPVRNMAMVISVDDV